MAIFLILMLGIMPSTTNAALVWEDNFDDGNYDGWSITGVNGSITHGYTEVDGNFTADYGYLEALGPYWNHAQHPSLVANGTWSFDIDAVNTPEKHFYVIFMSVDANITEGAPDGYSFMIATDPYTQDLFMGYALLRYGGGVVDGPPLGVYETDSGVRGIHHIDITRDLSGEFNIYIDGCLRITTTDTTYTRSEYFRFHTPAGPSIDNITVYDTVEDIESICPTTTTPPITTTTPNGTPPPSIPLEWIAIGGGAVVLVLVIVVVLKRK
jgi:hypothetical protein